MTKPANSKQLVHVTVSTAVVAAVDLIAAQQFTTRSSSSVGPWFAPWNARAAVLFGRLLPSRASDRSLKCTRPHRARLGDQSAVRSIRPNLVILKQ